MNRPFSPRPNEASTIGDGLLERVIRILGVDVQQARKLAPKIQTTAEALVAAAETFAHRMKS